MKDEIKDLDKELEEKEKLEKELKEYGWAWIFLVACIFGFNGRNPEIDALKERVSKLEAKNEIIEKLVTK